MLRQSIQFYIMITVNENVDTEKKTMKLAESELNYANMHALSHLINVKRDFFSSERFIHKKVARFFKNKLPLG